MQRETERETEEEEEEEEEKEERSGGDKGRSRRSNQKRVVLWWWTKVCVCMCCGMVFVGWLGRGNTALHCTHHVLTHMLKSEHHCLPFAALSLI